MQCPTKVCDSTKAGTAWVHWASNMTAPRPPQARLPTRRRKWWGWKRALEFCHCYCESLNRLSAKGLGFCSQRPCGMVRAANLSLWFLSTTHTALLLEFIKLKLPAKNEIRTLKSQTLEKILFIHVIMMIKSNLDDTISENAFLSMLTPCPLH